MNYIFRLSFLIYIMGTFISSDVNTWDVVVLLALFALDLFKSKFLDTIKMNIAEYLAAFAASLLHPVFAVTFALIAYDFAYKKALLWLIPVTMSAMYFSQIGMWKELLLLILVCVVFAYTSAQLMQKEKLSNKLYDLERRNRYELEKAKTKLMDSAKEAAHLAEIKERNRIARDLHDHLGHSIAGILLQLQASLKLREIDTEKSLDLMQNSISGLSQSLNLLRDTVHNIRPHEKLGADYLKNVIENFSFCEIEFKHTGDFNLVSADQLETMSTNIKEALTNASKYSMATKINISIEVNEKFVRLYIKDNGIGTEKIKEGLGISGMKERVKNLGGSLSISSQEGFLIVCLLPILKGGENFESFNRG